MEDKQKHMQEKYVEFQLLDQQIKQLQQQIQVMEQQMMELNAVRQSLDDLKNIKAGSEILTPLNSGIFAKAEIKDPNELLVNIGADVVVKKDIGSTKEMITNQLNEMDKIHTQMHEELQNSVHKARSMQEELVKLVEE